MLHGRAVIINGETDVTLEYGCGRLRRGGRYKLYEILDYLSELASETDRLNEELTRQREIRDEFYVRRSEMSIAGMRNSDFM